MLQIDYATLNELDNAGYICIRVIRPYKENAFKKICYLSSALTAPIAKDEIITINDNGFVDNDLQYYDNVQVQILVNNTLNPFTSLDYAAYLLTK
jgi:hypothetical protein